MDRSTEGDSRSAGRRRRRWRGACARCAACQKSSHGEARQKAAYRPIPPIRDSGCVAPAGRAPPATVAFRTGGTAPLRLGRRLGRNRRVSMARRRQGVAVRSVALLSAEAAEDSAEHTLSPPAVSENASALVGERAVLDHLPAEPQGGCQPYCAGCSMPRSRAHGRLESRSWLAGHSSLPRRSSS